MNGRSSKLTEWLRKPIGLIKNGFILSTRVPLTDADIDRIRASADVKWRELILKREMRWQRFLTHKGPIVNYFGYGKSKSYIAVWGLNK